MGECLARAPVPICGVALAFAGLASLLHRWDGVLWIPLAVLSLALLGVYGFRCIAVRGSLRADLFSPVPACVLATCSMALQILSPLLGDVVGTVMLAIGLSFQVALILNFTVRFLRGLQLKGLLATIFVPYVGVAASGISAPMLGYPGLGAVCTCAALAMAFPLMAAVLYRYAVLPVEEPSVIPAACIAAAPFSICTVAMSGLPGFFPAWSVAAVYPLALVCYAWVLVRLPGILRMGFVPGHASTTFPLVISATATLCASSLASGALHSALLCLFAVQIALAAGLTVYVLAGMCRHILRAKARSRCSPIRECHVY